MKYIILLAAVLIQVCLGGLYAWTAFVPELTAAYGLSIAQTQVIFGAAIAFFTITMFLAGRILAARGPRLLLVSSGVLFGAGYGLASLSGGNFPLLLLGAGVVTGIATGLGYLCPLVVCMKWFPRHKGLVTGIAVAGFGGGAILLANLIGLLLERGSGVLNIFRWVGLTYGTAIIAAGLVIRLPDRAEEMPAAKTAVPETSVVRDPFFWALTCAMFCGTFAGLLVIGNLTPMALAAGIEPFLAAVGISLFAIGNSLGRIAWGRVVDRTGTRAIQFSLFFIATILVILLAYAPSAASFVVISTMIGFGFGSCFVIHAALVASRYGAAQVGQIYPLVFLAYGVAGITGPAIGGWLYDFTGSYAAAISVSIVLVLAGLLGSGLLMVRVTRLSPERAVETRAEN